MNNKLITDKKYAILTMASDKIAFEIIIRNENTAIIKYPYNGNEIKIKKNKKGFIYDEYGNRYYFSDIDETITDYNY